VNTVDYKNAHFSNYLQSSGINFSLNSICINQLFAFKILLKCLQSTKGSETFNTTTYHRMAISTIQNTSFQREIQRSWSQNFKTILGTTIQYTSSHNAACHKQLPWQYSAAQYEATFTLTRVWVQVWVSIYELTVT